MARVKVKVDRGNGLQQTVVIDTDATQGATLGTDVYLNGRVATPAAFLTWLGISSSGSPSAARGRPLTVNSDTNLTLTLGGAPGSALLTAASITASWSGTLAATRGGTGFGSYTAGDLLYANSGTTLAKLPIGSAGDLLRVSGGAPAWQAPSTLGANPSATFGVNLVGANGSASTFLRSDAVLKLDQSISPTWSGDHAFNGKLSATLQNFVDDAAAAAGGIAVGQFYRNGSVVMVRVT